MEMRLCGPPQARLAPVLTFFGAVENFFPISALESYEISQCVQCDNAFKVKEGLN